MRRALLCVLSFGLLLIPGVASAQSTSTDSQTLQELLKEVRQLRQDLRTIATTSQRAQILLSREQVEQASVASAQKELDSANSRVSEFQRRERDFQEQIQAFTDEDNEDRTPDASSRQRLEAMIARFKSSLEQESVQEQSAMSSQMQAKDRLQIEQGKLDALQSELDRLDKDLQDLGTQPVN